jgi:hypothetical protein
MTAKNVEAVGERRRGRGGEGNGVGVGMAELRGVRRVDKLGRIRCDCGRVVVERVVMSCKIDPFARC